MWLLWLENRECLGPGPTHPQKALGVELPDSWSDAVFDDEHLVSCAGLVPVMGLAERTGLPELIGQRVRWKTCRVASAGRTRSGNCQRLSPGWRSARTASRSGGVFALRASLLRFAYNVVPVG